MIRQIIKLAIEAVKVEAQRWLEPTQEPAPVVAAPVESKWSCPKFHMEALASTTCPECNGPKQVHWYMCSDCRKPAARSSSGGAE
jgi:hypothetical protein